MQEHFDLQQHIARGVERIVADALKATLKDPRESAFMVRFAAAAARATNTRLKLEKEGLHVPSFLIASITDWCNLDCAGCYSRRNAAAREDSPARMLSREEWGKVFREAEALGVSFILLAGGEPMLRRDVIEVAGGMPNLLFPTFTNGTMIDDEILSLFDRCRNLVPVLSIEGGPGKTDARRGAGTYDRLIRGMEALHAKHLLFGASVTVTTENLAEVTSVPFISALAERGCKLIFYIEFVPVIPELEHLAPGDSQRKQLAEAMDALRREWPELILLAFPGDERADDGCMAAGRGFFHINSRGGAEPCPFSPYSDTNVLDSSLRDAMASKLFLELRARDLLEDEHVGGCVLFQKRAEVESLLHREDEG